MRAVAAAAVWLALAACGGREPEPTTRIVIANDPTVSPPPAPAAAPARTTVPEPQPTATPTNQEIARDHYRAGAQFYDLGEFDRAVVEFKAAYEIVPSAVLLYNIAQAYRMSGDKADALQFYKLYLSAKPDAPNRADVEAQIQALGQP